MTGRGDQNAPGPGGGGARGIFHGSPRLRRATLMLLDAVILSAGLALNLEIWLRFRHGFLPEGYRLLFFHVAPPIVLLRIGLFSYMGVYTSLSRLTGARELARIAAADTIATCAIIPLNFCAELIPSFFGFPLHPSGDHLLRLPWGVVFNDWMLAMISVGGIRLARREIALRSGAAVPGEVRRVMIIGSGRTGEAVARDLESSTGGRFRPVALLDPDPAMEGHVIHGVPVTGTPERLEEQLERHAPDEIVIALSRPTPREVSGIIGRCRSARLSFRIVPPLESLMSGGVEMSTMRRVEIDDLLGRAPVGTGETKGPEYLSGARVLVTGAGGSIGREICRQVLACGPAHLVMLGRGENSLFEAAAALLEDEPSAGGRIRMVIGDVRDHEFLDALTAEVRPDVVIHAAAHKHVHLMEAQPAEAVKNNVLGTVNVAMAARDAGVGRFILISTDKAVRPTGVMGATKRVAESVVAAMAADTGAPMISVRFGNVLGSRGSVIPTFRRQIERGGPVTVTHPEVTRYFMTTAEAVHLTLHAGALGTAGDLFVLDMGEPVRVADLARNLITLSGLEPETDIAIEFTGLRPGEKLSEEVMSAAEGLSRTDHGKLMRIRGGMPDPATFKDRLNALLAAAQENRDADVRALLHELVPDYSDAVTAAAAPGGHGDGAADAHGPAED